MGEPSSPLQQGFLTGPAIARSAIPSEGAGANTGEDAETGAGKGTSANSAVSLPGCTCDPSTPSRAASGASTLGPSSSAMRRRITSSSSTIALPSPTLIHTPHTQTGKAPSCTDSEAAFISIAVRTAKCSECDQRNKAVMRRCPGCTFQVCTPCYGKRKREGRDLRHGIAMNGIAVSGSASSATARTPRSQVLRSSSVGMKSGEVEERVEEREGEGVEASGGDVVSERTREEQVRERQRKEKVMGKIQVPRKRAVIKKPLAEESDEEDISSESCDTGKDVSPTPSKRRRTASTLIMEKSTPTEFEAPKRTLRKLHASAGRSTNRAEASSNPDASSTALTFTSVSLKDMSIGELMRHHGVNTPDNPYHEHPLGRRQYVFSNPQIRIPDIVKRNFKNPPTALEIQKNIQGKVLEKMGGTSVSGQNLATGVSQCYGITSPVNDTTYTVQMMVQAETAKYRDSMNEGESEALIGA